MFKDLTKTQWLGIVLLTLSAPFLVYLWFYQTIHWGDMTQKAIFLGNWKMGLSALLGLTVGMGLLQLGGK